MFPLFHTHIFIYTESHTLWRNLKEYGLEVYTVTKGRWTKSNKKMLPVTTPCQYFCDRQPKRTALPEWNANTVPWQKVHLPLPERIIHILKSARLSCTTEQSPNIQVYWSMRLVLNTLRVFTTGDNLLCAEDGGLSVVGQDTNASLQHAHRCKGIATATRTWKKTEILQLLQISASHYSYHNITHVTQCNLPILYLSITSTLQRHCIQHCCVYPFAVSHVVSIFAKQYMFYPDHLCCWFSIPTKAVNFKLKHLGKWNGNK